MKVFFDQNRLTRDDVLFKFMIWSFPYYIGVFSFFSYINYNFISKFFKEITRERLFHEISSDEIIFLSAFLGFNLFIFFKFLIFYFIWRKLTDKLSTNKMITKKKIEKLESKQVVLIKESNLIACKLTCLLFWSLFAIEFIMSFALNIKSWIFWSGLLIYSLASVALFHIYIYSNDVLVQEPYKLKKKHLLRSV